MEDIMFEITENEWENEEEKIDFIVSKTTREQVIKYIDEIYNSQLYNYVKIKEYEPILKYYEHFKLTKNDKEELESKILLLKLYVSKEENEWITK